MMVTLVGFNIYLRTSIFIICFFSFLQMGNMNEITAHATAEADQQAARPPALKAAHGNQATAGGPPVEAKNQVCAHDAR
jgi:hypothetical protein